MDTDSLISLLDRFHGLNVWVVGDLMIDEYIQGAVERVSPEAPVPVVRVANSERRLGGAANVARQPDNCNYRAKPARRDRDQARLDCDSVIRRR